MHVKYKQDKQTCQTLRQNNVQLNKSMTSDWQSALTRTLLTISFALLLGGILLGCGAAEEPVTVQDSSETVSVTVVNHPPTFLATKAAVTTVQPHPQATASPATPPAVVQVVLVPTATSTTSSVLSPLSTPPMHPPLSFTTTVALQSSVAISVAQVAQALLEAIQQPVYVAPPFTVTTSLALTTASGLLPPLPPSTGDLLPLGPAVAQDRATADSSASVTPPPVFVLPQLQADGELRSARVPILMYHYLSEPPPNADIYRRDLSVSPALFAAHLDRINAERYTVISLYALIAHLTEGTPLPPKPVVLTFDDGYRDNYENAFPLLRTYGVTATFFIVMEFINRERPEYLTWEMVKEMAAGGMSIEAHGVDHTTLRGRSAVDLEFQALRSYETLQNALGVRAHLISYPAGEFDEQTIAIFQKAGYWAGFTTVQGATHRSDDLFRLPRVRIRGSTTPDELARLLALDW